MGREGKLQPAGCVEVSPLGSHSRAKCWPNNFLELVADKCWNFKLVMEERLERVQNRFLFLKIYYVDKCSACIMPTGQKRSPDLIADGYEQPSGSWEFNSGPRPLEGQTMLSEPSLQPFSCFCFCPTPLFCALIVHIHMGASFGVILMSPSHMTQKSWECRTKRQPVFL